LRLAGLYFRLLETEKATYHLKNGMRFDQEHLMIVEELFPEVYKSAAFNRVLKK